jgi:hypothetical protein
MAHILEWPYKELSRQFDEILKQPPLWYEFWRIVRSAETDVADLDLDAMAALVRHAREACPPPLLAMLAEQGIADFIRSDEWIGCRGCKDEELAAQFNQVLAQNPSLWGECFRLFEMEGTEYAPPDPPADIVRRVHNICPPPLRIALAEWTTEYLIHSVLREKILERDCAVDARDDDAPQGRIH